MNTTNHEHQNRRNDARKDKLRASVLSRLGRKLARLIGQRPVREEPTVQTDWRAIISGAEERSCPASEFRKLSEELRVAGRFAEANRICTRGNELHPGNLWLALIHAKIADSMEDPSLSLERWRRVIEIGGDKSPSRAFKNVADGLQAQGDFSEAEALVRQGMATYPEDPNLEERLARISYAAGFSAQAIARWTELLGRHPGMDGAWIHRRIGEALCSEGLPDRAAAAFEEGLAKYPEDERLLKALARVNTPKFVPAAEVSIPAADFTGHLFGGKAESFGRGTCAWLFALDEANQHVPTMLNFAECVAPFQDRLQAAEVDVFAVWGASSNHPHPLAARLAKATGKPHLCLDAGFVGPSSQGTPHLSIFVYPGSNYFDRTRPSALEDRLNSGDFHLDQDQRERAAACIAQIAHHRITPYNHAPKSDLRGRFPANGRRRVLLVDQRFGDLSVEKGLGCGSTFERMLDAALKLPDHDVLIKLDPEAGAGGQASYFRRILPDPLPPNVAVVDFEVNPFCLFEVVDRVFVCTSQLGFEALMAGKEVDCFGTPFYAGWGLTNDRAVIPRRRRRRLIEEIFHLFYLVHSRYFVPGRGVAEIEDLIQYLVKSGLKKSSPTALETTHDTPIPDSSASEALRILMILPSPRQGASGRYFQTLAQSLCRLGCQVQVLAEGKNPTMEHGVGWLPLAFEGAGLAASLRKAVMAFAPDIVYENGVRSRSQRAALEVMILTGARLAMQSEDDDLQVYETHHGKAAAAALTLVDKPVLTLDDIARYLELIDLKHSLNVFLEPSHDRWVEPLTRALCYRLASLHTAIWQPFEERLAREYGMPTLVVPPVAAAADFERIPTTPDERGHLLARHGIDPNRVVIFIGGALYSYSDEYAVFLDALNRTVEKTSGSFALVVTSGRSALPIARMARERLRPEIAFADIDLTADEDYMGLLKACDVVCSPGLPDDFNRFRLPSRLIKAMAMAKPILTCRCGFGESLENGFNAFLMDGTDPAEWAESIGQCLNQEKRSQVGAQGRIFARQHFDSDRVAAALKEKFLTVMESPPRTLADGISHGIRRLRSSENLKRRAIPDAWPPGHRDATMRDAIRGIAVESGRLGTVVHLGAGHCGEFWDYCRLGTQRMLLVDASGENVAELQKLADADGRIMVRQAVISGGSGSQSAFVMRNARTDGAGGEQLSLLPPDRFLELMPAFRVIRQDTVTTTIAGVCDGLELSSPDNLLVLELNGVEASALAVTPATWLCSFRWIALRASDPPLFEGGTTPDEIRSLMRSAGFEQVATPPNHGEAAALLLFQRSGAAGTCS